MLRRAALTCLLLSPCLVFMCLALVAPRPAAAADNAPLPKLAVFDIELDDFTAGGPIAGESAEETQRLRRMTLLARDLLRQSGLFELVDPTTSTDQRVKDRWLRKCNGCDADIARDFGADLSFIAFFRKISVMEQYLEFRITDVKTGEVVNFSHTDLRNETDESWRRALVWLIRYRLVEPERARLARVSAQ